MSNAQFLHLVLIPLGEAALGLVGCMAAIALPAGAACLLARVLRRVAMPSLPFVKAVPKELPAPAVPALPQRIPAAAAERQDRLDAILAQCTVSEQYVTKRLDQYEGEVSYLLPLALQLDDPADIG